MGVCLSRTATREWLNAAKKHPHDPVKQSGFFYSMQASRGTTGRLLPTLSTISDLETVLRQWTLDYLKAFLLARVSNEDSDVAAERQVKAMVRVALGEWRRLKFGDRHVIRGVPSGVSAILDSNPSVEFFRSMNPQ